MEFVVTARKWRPQLFEDVVGQEHITTTLKNAIVNKRIAHAFIFAGPRGVGKTTTARILAKSLNCLNPTDGEPCNNCEMCKSFQTSQSMDIIEIDGASNRRIDEIRTLRESVKYAPSKGKYKIYIIDEVHMLTTESFNALLKTLEEPPEHTIFVFATTDIHKVPLTIISRCQRFDFRRIELDAIKKQLKLIADNEKIKIDDQSLTLIAKKADGALRDAQSLFDQVISFCGNDVKSNDIFLMLNLINEEIYFDLTNAILQKDFKVAFEVCKEIYDNGWNYVDFFDGLIEHFRNILTVIITGNHKLIEAAEIFKNRYLVYQNKFNEADILRILAFLNRNISELKNVQNQKLKSEIILSHLIGLERTSTITELISKIDLLKNDKEFNLKSESHSDTYNESTNSKRNSTDDVASKVNVGLKSPNSNKDKTITSFKSPTVNPNSDLNQVIDKWSEFLTYVEKDYSFGPLLNNSQPLGVNDSIVEITVENDEDIQHLNSSREKFDLRSKEFFGKPIEINFISKTGKKIEDSDSEIEQFNSPLSRAVVDQLGGREIR